MLFFGWTLIVEHGMLNSIVETNSIRYCESENVLLQRNELNDDVRIAMCTILIARVAPLQRIQFTHLKAPFQHSNT